MDRFRDRLRPESQGDQIVPQEGSAADEAAARATWRQAIVQLREFAKNNEELLREVAPHVFTGGKAFLKLRQAKRAGDKRVQEEAVRDLRTAGSGIARAVSNQRKR